MGSTATSRRQITDNDISPETGDNEETMPLPVISLPERIDGGDVTLEQISSQLDELISLGRSMNDHLEQLAKAAKTPKSRQKTRRGGSKSAG